MESGSRPIPEALEACRRELDKLDEELIRLIARRLDLGLQAAVIKTEEGLPIIDAAREEKVLEQARAWARESHLSEDEVMEIFSRLIAISGKAQLESGGQRNVDDRST